MWENFLHIKPRGGGVSTHSGGGVSPRIFLKNGCKWCIFCPFFAEFVLIFPKKICVIFAFKALIFDILDVGEFSPYKAKDGSFYPLTLGGGRGLPDKILQNGCKWCILSLYFCRACVDSFPQIVCNFCLQSSDLRYICDAGEFFPFAWGGDSSSPIF